MSYSKIFLLACVVLFFGFTTDPGHTRPDDSSIVIGSLEGTLLKPPHSFLGNAPNIGGDRGSVEFKGFKLIGKDDQGKFAIRPLQDSFFRQTLPPGEYLLVRERRDRPSYKEDKSIEILSFNVPANAMVNLGTIEIVLEGSPEESLGRSFRGRKGTYTYRYRYERSRVPDAMKTPLEWFLGKASDAGREYPAGVVDVTGTPTDKMDSSRFILREQSPGLFPWWRGGSRS